MANSVGLILQVLVWRTNFDQIDYSEVLSAHAARTQGEVEPPTIHDIPPRSAGPKSAPTNVSDLLHLNPLLSISN